MTTQDLKNYINRVLGNGIRCILPSYWWKRLFGLVVDKVEDVEGKIEKEVPELIASSLAEFAEKYPDVESRTFYIEGNTEKNAALYLKIMEEYESGIVQQVYLATYFNGYSGKLIVTSPQLLVNSALTFVNVAYPVFRVRKDVLIYEDGTVNVIDTEYGGSTITIDSALSDTSTNAVQNKAITEAMNNKVDKVDGKQLSTEDFTTALKTKLEGLSNYDDTEISNALTSLETQINTLVSGDASSAIESFNEIIAFLNGIEDSESLDSIVASIEQQIAAKQDKIDDLETIRSGAALGATALQSYTEKYTGTYSKPSDGIPKADLAGDVQTSLGKADTALQEHQDISHLATKEEVVANEEVTAAALNELNERVIIHDTFLSGACVTKNELDKSSDDLTEVIINNEKVVSASLAELNRRISELSSIVESLINII